jgi:hypothetical protein
MIDYSGYTACALPWLLRPNVPHDVRQSRGGPLTAQFPERLTYRGEKMDMYTEPLREYLAKSGAKLRFQANSSALWRGYMGRWEIVDGQLYLIGLEGALENGAKASLSTVFPNASDRVLAHWYSGTLRIPKGTQLKYIHMGYGSIFEYDLFLEVLQGHLVATRLHRNEVTDPDYDDDIPF